MSDVFISYAREDRDCAQRLAEVFERRGWSVWWDREILTGKVFDTVIEDELHKAKSVVVLWSTNSAVSEWVRNEASAAAELGRLVPALIENVKIPFEFRRRQTAMLIGWDGDESQEGFVDLCQGVAAAISGAAPADPAIAVAPLPVMSQAPRPAQRAGLAKIGGAGLAALLALAAYWAISAPPPKPDVGEAPKADSTKLVVPEEPQKHEPPTVSAVTERQEKLAPVEAVPVDQSAIEQELAQAKAELAAAHQREKEHEAKLAAAVAAAERAAAAAEASRKSSDAAAGREAAAKVAQARAEDAQRKAEAAQAAREKAQRERAERKRAEAALKETERKADAVQASVAGKADGGGYQAANKLPIIGYVMFSVIDKIGRPRKEFFSIDGKPEVRFPSPNDVLTPVLTNKRDKIALRGQPFRWDPATKASVDEGPELVYLKAGNKVRVGGDVFISTDPHNGEQYAIAPVTEAINLRVDAAGKSVFSLDRANPDIAGYVYVGMVDDQSGEFVNRYFENETRPNSLYPAPKDRLRAVVDVNMRKGPRYWDAGKGDYVTAPKVGDIKAGQVIEVGGDALTAKGGQTIWAPVAASSLK